MAESDSDEYVKAVDFEKRERKLKLGEEGVEKEKELKMKIL